MKALLRGESLGAARRSLDELSRSLLRLSPARAESATMRSGSAGIALAHAYLAPLFSEREHARRVAGMLDHACDAAGTEHMRPSLHNGFIGIAWTLEHLEGSGRQAGAEDP